MDLKEELGKRYNVVILLSITIAIIATVYIAYQDLVYSYLNIILMENYSYLIVAIPLTLWIFVKIILNRFTVEGLNIFRAIASIMSFSVSLLMYILGDSIPSMYLELKALSLVLLLWSFIVLFFRSSRKIVGFLAMFSLLLLVPIPRELLDFTASTLTEVVAKTVAILTNTSIIKSNGIITLVVKDVNGINRFYELAPICSGVVSLLSTTSILPAILYIALYSKSTLKRKVTYIALSFLAATSIVFVGNILRIIAIILVAKFISFDMALEFFHYTPSIIYVAIATALSIYIVSKLNREGSSESDNNYAKIFMKPSIGLVASIAILIILTTLFNLLAPQTSIYVIAQKTPYTLSLPTFLQNPTYFLFNTSNVFILRDVPEPRLSISLGIPTVRGITLLYNDTMFLGYVEIADIPTRFHGWYVCLTAQGYVIERSWSEANNITINNIIASKSGTRILLSYAIYRYASAEGTSYVRVSLITPIADDYTNQLLLTRTLLNDVTLVEFPRPGIFTLLDISMILVNVSFVLGLVSVVLHLIGRKLYSRSIAKFEGVVKQSYKVE